MTPTIGITRCSRLDDYVSSVEQAGARARVLDVTESPRKVIGELHGLLLTGGGDIDPAFYGEDRHETVEDAEPGRDEFELDLARRAIDADLPVLAICRGAQVLNVAAGGSLVQDLVSEQRAVGEHLRPDAGDAGIAHAIASPKDHVAHDVSVSAESVLARALGSAVEGEHLCRVNSRHHQSVRRLGRSLVASATAPDGVIEAIEAPDARFCVGVQWHPENFWRTGEFRPLFDAFVAAARGLGPPAQGSGSEGR